MQSKKTILIIKQNNKLHTLCHLASLLFLLSIPNKEIHDKVHTINCVATSNPFRDIYPAGDVFIMYHQANDDNTLNALKATALLYNDTYIAEEISDDIKHFIQSLKKALYIQEGKLNINDIVQKVNFLNEAIESHSPARISWVTKFLHEAMTFNITEGDIIAGQLMESLNKVMKHHISKRSSWVNYSSDAEQEECMVDM